MTERAAHRTSTLDAWQRAAGISVVLAAMLLLTMVLLSIAIWLAATVSLRLSLAAAAVVVAASGWSWLTRRASALRKGLDDLVNQDRLTERHGGRVDAFVIDGIKSRRRFAFQKLLLSRVALVTAAVLCVMLAVLGSRSGDGASVEDPDSVATDAGWIMAKSELIRGDAALRAGDPALARGHYTKAGASTDKLRETRQHDAPLARASVAAKARLAHTICLSGDAAAAAAPLGEALAIVRSMLPEGRDASPSEDSRLAALAAWLEHARRLVAQGACPDWKLPAR